MPKKSIKLEEGWRWAGKWQIEGKDVRPEIYNPSELTDGEKIDHDGSYDDQGWQYSERFGNFFVSH